VVLDTACKTVRDWVQKLVNLVLKGDEGGDRSDLEYAKNFYDVGRATMNRILIASFPLCFSCTSSTLDSALIPFIE
jgi:hypothetical protein